MGVRKILPGPRAPPAPDGIVIADAEGRYLEANSSLCRMLGYSAEEMVGKNALDIVVRADDPRHLRAPAGRPSRRPAKSERF